MEIVFSDSACGSLKMAQRYGKGKFHGGSIGVIVSHADGSKPTRAEIHAAKREAEKKARLAWECATPMGGNSADIYSFHLVLSLGDISEHTPGILREQTLRRLYSVYPNDEGYAVAQNMLRRAGDHMRMVRERAEAGDPIRIWYSDQPDEMCGLYWCMEQLSKWKIHHEQIFTVELPKWEEDEHGNIMQKSSWSDLSPGEWHRYPRLQKNVSSIFKQSCASHWNELQRENAPLRAVLNGRLVSAPETLYDDFIVREIAAEEMEFQEAMIIGRVLGKYQLGIGDSFIASRIEEMLRAGKLEVLSPAADDMPSYHRRLKKCAGTL